MPEITGCPLCGTSESAAVIQDNGYTGRQCASCGLIYVSPRPTREEMEQIYAAGEAYLSPEFFLANTNSLAGRLASREAVGVLGRHLHGGALLEIGPGDGAFLAEARKRGFDPYGVELNALQAEFIRTRRGIPCVTSLAEARELGPGQFDAVFHRDVISHFYDPIEQLREIASLLRPGGLHVIITGNFGDVDHRHFERVRSFQYPDHLFFYSERSLRELLVRTGFEHVQTRRLSLRPEQALRTLVWRVSGRLHPAAQDGSGPSPKDEPVRPAPPSRVGALARDALDVTYSAIRHTAGRLSIRAGDPQTLTVIARRTG